MITTISLNFFFNVTPGVLNSGPYASVVNTLPTHPQGKALNQDRGDLD